MKLVVWKNSFAGQILYRSVHPAKKRRQYKMCNTHVLTDPPPNDTFSLIGTLFGGMFLYPLIDTIFSTLFFSRSPFRVVLPKFQKNIDSCYFCHCTRFIGYYYFKIIVLMLLPSNKPGTYIIILISKETLNSISIAF